MLLNTFPTIESLNEAFDNKKISALELTQSCLAAIQTHQQLNAWVDINEDASLAQAKAADAQRANHTHTPLTGVPIGHKDVFVTRHWRTTAASKMLQNYQSPFDATVVERLQNAGSITLGKLNCDEFAMGSDSQTSVFGPTLNPWDLTRTPGGSSSGSAAAIAAGLALAATGSDTGGSIRQPAAFCGISGIKPTYGTVSRYGMVAYGSSLDQAGPMARHARDLLYLLETMGGFDERDPTSLTHCGDQTNDGARIRSQFEHWHQQFQTQDDRPLKGLRIGIIKEFLENDLQPEVVKSLDEALQTLEKLGAERVEVSLPLIDMATAAYYVISPAEASSNLSRFDGVRFGHRTEHYQDLHEMTARSRSEGFGPEVKRRILAGTYVLSEGHYETFFLQAQRVRAMILEQYQAALAQCDVIFAPVSAGLPQALNQTVEAPTDQWRADRYTLSVNLAGLPALSAPCGQSSGDKPLPIGMQLIGNYFQEGQLLAIADCFQTHTDWHQRTPEL
ncbi:MAG TPA: Asp-tRNA(Asn)/Glu-tRNA(Gln) amidotransferase subunit GatA [Paenalcaligenes sp.]|nr:Asp-tRNA(Asn)/Glu-tRNA(Gln) amidotransferase subunit GatA [Paenalcaligenes sp.]